LPEREFHTVGPLPPQKTSDGQVSYIDSALHSAGDGVLTAVSDDQLYGNVNSLMLHYINVNV